MLLVVTLLMVALAMGARQEEEEKRDASEINISHGQFRNKGTIWNSWK